MKKNEYNFIGMTFAPEEAWLWDEKRLKEFLDEQENWGRVMVITNGWRYRQF